MEIPPQPAIPIAYQQASYMAADVEHLKLLSIFHYIVGGLTMAFSCFCLIYIVMGIVMLSAPVFAQPQPGNPQTAQQTAVAQSAQTAMGWIMFAMGATGLGIGWTIGILLIASGRCIAKYRRRTFSIVIAALSLIAFPFGTTLGIFTLIVLLRNSVFSLYAATPSQ